jgi:homoserine dehydrogenase
MTVVRILICGFGRVGQAFAGLLDQKAEQLRTEYGLELRVTAVVDIGGASLAPEGLPIRKLLDHVRQGGRVETFPSGGHRALSGVDVIRSRTADLLVETTPTSIVDGEPALTHLRAALSHGLHVVTAAKGPLVVRYGEIKALAREKGVRLMTSAATAAALPTLDVALICLAGTEILSAEGILNGTTNYILTRMLDEGIAYPEALAEAQKMGIAEPDPSLDVEGRDTANKILLIANEIFHSELTLKDIPVEGITRITPAQVREAADRGTVIKLVGKAEKKDGRVQASVGPVALPKTHPLASVNGSEKAISYYTDTMDRVTVSGGKSNPLGAAAALLKDIINVYRK